MIELMYDFSVNFNIFYLNRHKKQKKSTILSIDRVHTLHTGPRFSFTIQNDATFILML